MPLRNLSLLLFLLCSFPLALQAQDSTALLSGRVTNTRGEALDAVIVQARSSRGKAVGSTQTDSAGRYSILLPAADRLSLLFDAYGIRHTERLTLTAGQPQTRNIEFPYIAENEGVIVRGRRESRDPGSVTMVDLPNIGRMVTLNDDPIMTQIQLQTGGKINDLSTQYSVRGGNYDENLVYVNDFEVYRPFLTRSGQQEGLGFVNSDLAGDVYFSVGGFQSRYGDKMSSVLDVTYKRPTRFAGSASMSLLGANAHIEGASRNQRLTYLVGLRQKTNQYILQSQPTTGVYNPSFTDAQALVHYDLSAKWEVEAIGNYARNRFSFIPEQQTTSFGVLSQAFQLQVFYNGHEIDQFDSRFGGLSTTYKPTDRLRLKLLASGFQTDERETYDIGGEYLLGELETDLGKESFGQIKTSLGTGIIQSHARNYLKVNVGTAAHRGWYDGGAHQISWGLDASVFSISDELSEWERRDSAGFTQPYAPDGTIRMAKYYRTSADFSYNRYSGFLQDNFRFGGSDSSDRYFTVSAGLRFNYSDLNGEFILSPRVQATYNASRRTLYKAAAGLYAQPPIYREMRDLNGAVNTQIRAQKSAHFVLGGEHNFRIGRNRDRNAKVTAEVYYKNLYDIVPFEYDNVRIRYFGQNNAQGYAYGGEVRLYGDLVKDAPSFISVGILKTAEDITNDFIDYKGSDGRDSARFSPGFVPRPGDQRFMLGMYFQDYLPRNKNFKAHLNALYGTGLPFGPPDGQRYADTLRLPDYKRVDIGMSALLLSGSKKDRPYYSFFRNLESVWLSVECFNLLGLRNTISYTWIQDQSSGRTFAVPNRLTARLLNVKLIVKF